MNQKLLYFLTRIDSLTPIHKSKYGKINVNQMVCHCKDFYHTALKEISLTDAPKILKEKVLILVKERKIVPNPKDINQVAVKSNKPNDFLNDIRLLKGKITIFFDSLKVANFSPYFYFGSLTLAQWNETSSYHLHHHLIQ